MACGSLPLWPRHLIRTCASFHQGCVFFGRTVTRRSWSSHSRRSCALSCRLAACLPARCSGSLQQPTCAVARLGARVTPTLCICPVCRIAGLTGLPWQLLSAILKHFSAQDLSAHLFPDCSLHIVNEWSCFRQYGQALRGWLGTEEAPIAAANAIGTPHASHWPWTNNARAAHR
jgi:hypothetical protein